MTLFQTSNYTELSLNNYNISTQKTGLLTVHEVTTGLIDTMFGGEQHLSPAPPPPPMVPQPISAQSIKASEKVLLVAQVKDLLSALTSTLWLLIGGQIVQEIILCVLLLSLCLFYRRWRGVFATTSSANSNASGNPSASNAMSAAASSVEVRAHKHKGKLAELRELFARWRAGRRATVAAGGDDTSGVELSYTDASGTKASSHVALEGVQAGGPPPKLAGADGDELPLQALQPTAPKLKQLPARLSQQFDETRHPILSKNAERRPVSLIVPIEVIDAVPANGKD